jgi:hypothetical protein
MDNCYICLEKTSIYYKLLNCNCSIYCHKECFQKILKLNKCIICKKNIYNYSLIDKVYNETENILFFRIIKILYDNYFLQYIMSNKSKINYLLFILYSIIISLFTISLSIIFLFIYLTSYIYYFLQYKNKIFTNYEKKNIENHSN